MATEEEAAELIKSLGIDLEEESSEESGDETTETEENSDDTEKSETESEETAEESTETKGEVTDPEKSETKESESEEGEGEGEAEENWEQRYKDTHKTYNEEHRQLLDAQKRINDLEANYTALTKAQTATPVLDDDDSEEFLKKIEEVSQDDPVEAIKLVAQHHSGLSKELLEQNMVKIQEQLRQQKLDIEQEIMRERHSDFDEVVTDYLVPQMQENPAIVQQWTNAGGTARAAYELGVNLKKSQDILKDPEAYEKRLRQKIEDESKGKKGKDDGGTTTLADVNSRTSSPTKDDSPKGDVLDAFFSKQDKEQKRRWGTSVIQ